MLCVGAHPDQARTMLHAACRQIIRCAAIITNFNTINIYLKGQNNKCLFYKSWLMMYVWVYVEMLVRHYFG